ncbi:MAG: DUF5674 family protein [bacterium]|nr:DUF5674 family protein [bacterium]MDZ4299771.1 DUF5674 family protein [Candidatus Sungbacteria bacterium]
MKIIRKPIQKSELLQIAESPFGNMVKGVVDLGRCVMAIGGELHADEEALLLEDGSVQEDVWGINMYPEKPEGEWIEFDSMINIRPSQHNMSRTVEDGAMREKIMVLIKELVV